MRHLAAHKNIIGSYHSANLITLLTTVVPYADYLLMAKQQITSISDLVDHMGGITEFARKGGWPLGTASAWKTRGTIPPAHWHRLIEVARADGIRLNAEKLLNLTQPETV